MNVTDIQNPSTPAYWPHQEYVTADMEGAAPRTLQPCGCHLRLPDYEAVLCNGHLRELNRVS